jgi:hypothetical protein
VVVVAAAASAEVSVRSPAARPRSAEEVIPPPVAETENAAPLYLEAIAVLEAEEVWGSNVAEMAAAIYAALYAPAAPGNLIALLEGFRIAREGNRQPTVAEACDEFSRRLETPAVVRAMALVDKAAGMPGCRFSIDYSKGAETLLPHLSRLRSLSRFLSTVAAATAEQGDVVTAWECVEWGLRLADCLRAEPLLISQLVRMAQAGIALAVLPQMADRGPPDAAIAARVDGLLDRLDDCEPWIRALDGERLLFGEWLLSQPAGKVQDLLKANGTPELSGLTPEQLAAGRQAYHEAMIRLAELAQLPYPEAKPHTEALMAAAADAGASPLLRTLLPALGSYSRKTAECQALIRVTRIGLRLKQHQAVHGAYPPKLVDLGLADIPAERQRDPFTDRPLCYRPEGTGFLLYSVGPDGVDNHGAPRHGDSKTGFDLVWRTVR